MLYINAYQSKNPIVPEEGWFGQPKFSTPSKNHPTLCRFLLLYILQRYCNRGQLFRPGRDSSARCWHKVKQPTSWPIIYWMHMVISLVSLFINLNNKDKTSHPIFLSLRSWRDSGAGERAARAREFTRRSTRLFTNPLTAWPLVFTASLPKQKHSRAKSRQLQFWHFLIIITLIINLILILILIIITLIINLIFYYQVSRISRRLFKSICYK